MSDDNRAFDAGETIVAGVDLRMPTTPQPIFFAGGTAIDAEIIAAIRRYIGEGNIISAESLEEFPKFCVYKPRPDGLVDAAVFNLGIERCFRRWGREAAVFEYCPIEHKFFGRQHEYFLPARIVFS